MLISESYLKQNTALHNSAPHYGAGGWTWIGPILKFMEQSGSKTLLDYGAGKGTLAHWLPSEVPIVNYDPVTFPTDPAPQDFVSCLDVMEHIEPDLLPAVLDHIRSKTLKAGLFVISLRPAKKVLDDGRNAHLIVKNVEWWTTRLSQHYRRVTVMMLGTDEELVALVEV